MVNKTIILEIEWKKGSQKNRKRLIKNKFLIEAYAYSCMETLEKELKKEYEDKK